MNRIFIIIGIPLAMLLSSCSTYKAVLYPCDFNKYKYFRSEFSKHQEVRYDENPEEWQSSDRSFSYKCAVESSATKGVLFSELTRNASNRDDMLILTTSTTDGVIFPPFLSGHLEVHFLWDWPPKTATIIATDSVTGGKLFEIYYSRYMISMDSNEFLDRVQSAVKYCIRELKKSPPKDGPRETSIPSS